MTMDQATKITVDCIRATSNFSGQMKAQDTLGEVGVATNSRIQGLRNRIVTNKQIGVPSVGHTLDPVFLQSMSSGWSVVTLILQIRQNSVSGNLRPATLRAEEALERHQTEG